MSGPTASNERLNLASGAKAGHSTERGPRSVLRRARRRPDVNEAGNAFMRREAERIEHGPIVGIPLGNPVRPVAKGVRGENQVHGGSAGGEHLLPFGIFACRLARLTTATTRVRG